MQLGKYQLVRKLATGGMAEVYLAKAAGPMGFEKKLVLKRILSHLAEDPQFVDMFLGEAKLAAMLNHPNVVQIFDFGEAEGAFFIAMELIDGPNLRALNKRSAELKSPIPYAMCAKIISYACEGLAYAHAFSDPDTGAALNLIHRDISPDNILVSRQGGVKVVDFGIAKAANQGHQTKTGTLKGKLSYMPPEQLQGKELDLRADIFSLGIVLYELVTGTKPYDATSEVSIMQAILYEPLIPARKRRPDVPEMLEKIIDKAMAKNRDERFASCRELQAELERFVVSTGESVSPYHLADLIGRLAPVPPAAGPGSSPGSAGSKSKPSTPMPRTPSRASASMPPPPPPSTRGAPEMVVEPPTQPPRLPSGYAGSQSDVRARTTGNRRPTRGSHADHGAYDDPPPRSGVQGKVLSALAGVVLAAGLFLIFRPFAPTARPPSTDAPAQLVVAAVPPPVTPVEPAVAPPAEAPEPEPEPVPVATAEPRKSSRAPARSARVPKPQVIAAVHREQPPEPAAASAASFVVESVPQAQVKVNGKFVGSSPTTVRNVSPGDVKVEVYDSNAGFAKEQTFTVSVGDNGTKRIVVNQGTLEFRVRPYASVFLDGKPLGQTPFPAVQAYEGRHRIKLVNKDLDKEHELEFLVKPGTNTVKYSFGEE